MLEQSRGCRRRLNHSAVRRQVSSQHRDSRLRLEWAREGADHFTVPALRIRHILPDRLSIYGHRVAMKDACLSKFPKHNGKTARVKEVLHQIFTRRLQVNQAGQMRTQ